MEQKHSLLLFGSYYIEQVLLKPLIELIFQLSFKKSMDIYYYHHYNIVLTKYAWFIIIMFKRYNLLNIPVLEIFFDLKDTPSHEIAL